MRATVCCLLAMLSWSASAYAQYGLDAWTIEQGLPQNVVRGVHQTRDGYLWVVTMDGVARFDGVRFTVFDRDTPGIRTNRFLTIYESANGDLWFGSERGVTRYRHGVFTTYAIDEGLPDPVVTGVTGDERGDIWVLSSDQIMQWADGRFRPAAEAVAGVRFARSRWRSDVFFGADAQRVYRFTGGRFTTWPLPEAVRQRTNGLFAQDQAGVLWMGLGADAIASLDADERLREYQFSSSRAGDGEPSRAHDPRIVHRDSQGRAWTIRLDHRLSRFALIPAAGRPEGLRFDALCEDRDGNVWLASYNQGLYRIRNQAVRVLSAERGLVGRNVYPILEDRRGAIWAGVWDGGVSRFEGGRFTNFTKADGLLSVHPTALAEDAAGRLWVAGHEAANGGLQILEHGRFRALPDQFLPERAVVSAILPDATGVWLGTNRGLVRYEPGRPTFFTVKQGLASDDVKVIIGDGRGGLWLGTTGGLSRLRDGRIESWTDRDGLPGGTIRALHLDAQGVLWIGSYDAGVGRLKDGRLKRFTTREGLFDHGAFRILETADGYLWISCNRGVYRVDKREMTAVAEGRLRRVHALALGRSDGLVNAEANGGAWPAGVAARDGTLWFPTQDGIAVIDPRTIGTDRGPIPAVIEALLVDREPVRLDAPVEIAPNQRMFELQYTALSFVSPDQLRFRYKMEGLDPDWEDAGTRRTAHYSYLPPGSYTFRVAVSNDRGVWSPAPASVSIVVLPPYWRTWWFGSLVTAALACLAAFIYRRRVRGLERAHAAQETFSRQLIASQEQERARIAGELHDSLGQSLIVICNWAALGTAVIEPKAAGREELEEISRAAQRAVDEVRSIAHSLGTHDLEQLGLADSLGEMVERVRRSSQLDITTTIEHLDGSLSREAETSIYRVAQEAMNNIIRHAGATKASVTLRQSPDRAVALTVQDNGRGFAPDAVRAGFGLKDMAERVRLFKGEFSLRSAPGGGTIVEVCMRSGADEDA